MTTTATTVQTNTVQVTGSVDPNELNSIIDTKLSINESIHDSMYQYERIVYTDEELSAIKKVHSKLINDHEIDQSRIGLRSLAVATIIGKCRVDETCKKYVAFLKGAESVGISPTKPLEMKADEWNDEISNMLQYRYQACGVDNGGRSIMWIRSGEEAKPGQEEALAWAGILYHLAVHADAITLREGVSFIIDASKSPSRKKNDKEKMMQKFNQTYPLRPQVFLILGANAAVRLLVNTIIKATSLVFRQKVLQRFRFVSVDAALDSLPKDSAPKYLGGGSGGIEDLEAWMKYRIESIPVPTI